MARKKYTTEDIARMQRKAEVELANGLPVADNPCGESVPVGSSECPGLQSLRDQVIWHAVRERR